VAREFVVLGDQAVDDVAEHEMSLLSRLVFLAGTGGLTTVRYGGLEE
jgi:hypothetical protein